MKTSRSAARARRSATTRCPPVTRMAPQLRPGALGCQGPCATRRGPADLPGGTGEDVEGEHAAHQRRPGPGARGGRGATAGRAGAGLVEGRIWGRRAAVADHVAAPAGMRGQDAVVEEQVDHGPGWESRQLVHELDGLEEQGRRAIAPASVLSPTGTAAAPTQ